MTALRIRARDLMTEQELIEVRTRSTWKSVALIAHAWTLISRLDRDGCGVGTTPSPSCWRLRSSARASSDFRS